MSFMSFRVSALSFSFLFLTACTASLSPYNEAPVKDNKACSLGAGLVHSWAKFGDLVQQDPPYLVTYEGCGKRLIYVAANHVNTPESPTYEMIRHVFENNNIDAVIVEGFPSEFGLSPINMISHAKSVDGTAADAEPYLVIREAVRNAATFQGGEPSDGTVLEYVSKRGYSPTDLLGYYIVRQIPQLIMSEAISGVDDPRLENEIFDIVGAFAQDTGKDIGALSGVDGLAPFSAWYEATNGIPLSDGYSEQDAWPATAVSEPKATNIMSDLVADARDRHIIATLNEALTENQTVLIVYGSSHHVIHAPALEAAFEITEDSRLKRPNRVNLYDLR